MSMCVDNTELKADTQSLSYRASVKLENGLALADEAYDYTITTKAGETVQRRGVATSVLKKIAGELADRDSPYVEPKAAGRQVADEQPFSHPPTHWKPLALRSGDRRSCCGTE